MTSEYNVLSVTLTEGLLSFVLLATSLSFGRSEVFII